MLLWWMTFADEYARLAQERQQPRPAPKKSKAAAAPAPVVKSPVVAEPVAPAVAQQDTQQLQEMLARTEVALRSAQEGRSAFLSAMSHELRTPLNAIMGFAEMMLNGVCGPLNNPTYLEYAQHIHDSGGELLSKVNDLLTIGSMNANELVLDEATFPLSELLAEAISLHSHAAFSRGMAITLSAPEGIEVQGDKRQLLCALAHFLSNAIHHSPDNKEIRISARCQAGSGLILSVRDAGEGIASAQLAKIQHSLQQEACYFTVQGGGIGLGLSLAQEIAARHGGRIMLDSIRHRGTVVSLILPSQRVVKGLPARKQATARSEHPGRVLEIL